MEKATVAAQQREEEKTLARFDVLFGGGRWVYIYIYMKVNRHSFPPLAR
jgi:hypothetical protein